MAIDSQGIALILGAVGILITTVGTFIVSMVTLFRQGRADQRSTERDTKIAQVHDLVNSQSEKLNRAIEAGALARGKIEGALEERANPSQQPQRALQQSEDPIPVVVKQPEPLPVTVVKKG